MYGDALVCVNYEMKVPRGGIGTHRTFLGGVLSSRDIGVDRA